MIKLRLSFNSEDIKNKEIEIVESEKLSDAITRSIDGIPLGKKNPEEVFQIVVNGLTIEKEFWEFTALKNSDIVIISPKIESGDSGQIFKQVALIAIAAIASVWLTPAGGATFLSAFGVGAVTMGAALILNALIPPPVPATPEIALAGNYESSQMYSITGQSNQVKRFESVPKVYGRHRMYPNIAAMPYTELETDHRTGEIVQYLYSLYDFGLGPMKITDLKIGDTPITIDNYDSFIYNFVDFNKPVSSEGVWDDVLQSNLTLYKGLPNTDSLGIVLDGNKNEDDPIANWQAIRYSTDNTKLVPQEIVLNFICPQGLFGYSATGLRDYRQIDLDISFSKADEDVWKKYNDLTYVDSFSSAGGDGALFELELELAESYVQAPATPPVTDDYYVITQTSYGIVPTYTAKIKPGTTKILVVDKGFDINVGSPVILYNYNFIGNVSSVEDYGPNALFKIVHLDRAVNNYRDIFHYVVVSAAGYGVYRSLGPYVRLTNSTPGRARIKSGSPKLPQLHLKLASSHAFAHPGTPDNDDYYTILSYSSINFGFFPTYYMRIKQGTTKILVDNSISAYTLSAGTEIKLFGVYSIGKIVSTESYIPNATYTIVHLDAPVNNASIVFTFRYNTDQTGYMESPVMGSYVGIPDPNNSQIQSDELTAVYSSFRFTPKEQGQFKVRVQRLNTSGLYDTQVADSMVWNSLTTRFDTIPVVTDKRHVFLEIKIKATGQLNGTISDLSGICESALEVYDDDAETWTRQLTRNPAWAFTDMLTGEINKKAVEKSRLDLTSIVEWADFCDEVPTPPPDQTYTLPRFESNFVFDYSSTLQTLLNQLGAAAQASLNIIDGKYGVLIDKLRTTPVQIFTPRNSSNFTSSRVYGPRPHAVKITYIDPNLDWNPTELVVYDDGYSEANATEFEALTSFACTNNEQAFRFGRYMLAQNRLRQETISIQVDFEYLVCTRGDYVQITQDVMRVGGTPARVKSVVGVRVTIDDALDIDGDLSYGYVYRSIEGEINTSTLTPVSPTEFDLDGDLPAVGDLIIIGEVDSIVFDCLVKSIAPNDDLSATLTLVEKADAIYSAESLGVLPDYDPQISITSDPDFAPPKPVIDLVVVDNDWTCAIGGGYKYFINISWHTPPGSIFEYFIIYVSTGTGFVESGRSTNGFYQHIVNQNKLGIPHQFKVIAVAASGKKISLGAALEVVATPVKKTTPPSDIEKVSIDITNEVLQLSWTPITDCDVDSYIIRYSPSLTATWDSSLPMLTASASANTTSVQARTGIYLIKAVDFNGNQSANATGAITSIPSLVNLNDIITIEEAPEFDGRFDRTEIDDDGDLVLRLQVDGDETVAEYYSLGYYYFSEVVNMNDIYTVRIQSIIEAMGIGDSGVVNGWSVEAQYRATNALVVMADWVTLDSVVTMDSGTGDAFTEWRTFTISDITARVIQFRLKLVSNQPNVSPKVSVATVKATMPDRIESFENVTATIADGYAGTYSAAFAGPSPSPNIQVSIQDAASGDYWSFDSRTLEGFVIRVFDGSANPVERTLDIAAKGWGRKASDTI